MPLRELGMEIAKGILTVTPGLGATGDSPLRRLWPMNLVEGESDLNSASL